MAISKLSTYHTIKRYFYSTPFWYVYPQWHTVSFTIVAKHHVAELKKYFRLYEIDELAFFGRDIYSKPVIIMHPYFFIANKKPQEIFNMKYKVKALIGIDVADTDKLGRIGVQLANLIDLIIVPSNFCKQVFQQSGVKTKIEVVPHGLSKLFFEGKRIPKDPYLKELYNLKQKKEYIYVLFFLIHSGERKGVDDVYEVMERIVSKYKNVKLIMKIGVMSKYHKEKVENLGGFIFSKYLPEDELVALYDMCDIYLGFSRGGGFEIPFLEALSRGVIVLTGSKGSWTDFIPEFLQIKKVHRVKFWKHTNPLHDIHCGYGYAVDIDEAVEKLEDVLNNLNEYKQKVKEYWEKIKHNYSWESIGLKLKSILEKYT